MKVYIQFIFFPIIGAQQQEKPAEEKEKPAPPKQEKKGTPPTFIGQPEIKQDGKNLIVHCKCKGQPKPTFTWSKNKLPLKETFRIKTRVDGKGEDYDIFLDLIVSLLLKVDIVISCLEN